MAELDKLKEPSLAEIFMWTLHRKGIDFEGGGLSLKRYSEISRYFEQQKIGERVNG